MSGILLKIILKYILICSVIVFTIHIGTSLTLLYLANEHMLFNLISINNIKQTNKQILQA